MLSAHPRRRAVAGGDLARPGKSGAAPELSTIWQAPPGDWLEHEIAGYAKILCSAIFITGRGLETAVGEDGFFVVPLESGGSR